MACRNTHTLVVAPKGQRRALPFMTPVSETCTHTYIHIRKDDYRTHQEYDGKDNDPTGWVGGCVCVWAQSASVAEMHKQVPANFGVWYAWERCTSGNCISTAYAQSFPRLFSYFSIIFTTLSRHILASVRAHTYTNPQTLEIVVITFVVGSASGKDCTLSYTTVVYATCCEIYRVAGTRRVLEKSRFVPSWIGCF